LTATDALETYTQRRDASAEQSAHWQRYERWLSTARLVVFFGGAALGWFAFGSRVLAPGWFGLAVLVFLALVVAHDRIIQRRTRADRCVGFYERGLARMQDRWAGGGESGEQHAAEGHPYADDLDLFGSGSLFELLCTARTHPGEATLASWLLQPAAVDEVRARQQAVEELRLRLDLREELALVGDEARSKLRPATLSHWGDEAARPVSTTARAALLGLAALGVATFAAWLTGLTPPWPWVAVLCGQFAVALTLRSRVRSILRQISVSTRDLRMLRELLAQIEAQHFESPRLVALRDALEIDGHPPSVQIGRLERLLYLKEARQNQFFAPIAAGLLWSTQVALAIESWHALCGPAIAGWIRATGDFEALCSLSAYAYEHPDDPFPELVEGEATFEGEGLGHPLLPADDCVRNDLALGGARRAYLLSGSNMSGKSTLLRTVGVNGLLAFAGAPVRATRLRISPLVIAASIRVRDSLQQGVSHFYAEIQQLQRVVELTAGDLPVLFLLDELLHGTNSHDRRIGSEAVLRGLVERGALGLVTTHDLALAKIADELSPRMENIHLEDHLEDGRMSFDYHVRPGGVTKSNALELMRSVGLEV
jgi:hypothetical protein